MDRNRWFLLTSTFQDWEVWYHQRSNDQWQGNLTNNGKINDQWALVVCISCPFGSHLDHASWGRVQAPQRVRRHLSSMSYFRTPWVMESWNTRQIWAIDLKYFEYRRMPQMEWLRSWNDQHLGLAVAYKNMECEWNMTKFCRSFDTDSWILNLLSWECTSHVAFG